MLHRLKGESMTLERIKPIECYDGYYITSWGRVYSENISGFLKPFITGKGYLKVDLHKDGKRTHKKVHRLVAEAFVPNPANKPQVNHKDGNKQNNSYTNLEWVTNQENVIHAQKMLKIIEELEELRII